MEWRVFPCARCTPRDCAGRRCLGSGDGGGGAAVGEAECGVFAAYPCEDQCKVIPCITCMKTRVSSPCEPHEACISSRESPQLSSLCRHPPDDPSLSSYRPRFARSDRGERSEMGGEECA